MKKVAIGGGQGFWGDSPDAAIHMIRNADIQYMGCDYLAELTLSIMAKQQLKDPTKGFAPDFTTRILKEAGKEAWDKHIKICTNAGGMNINGCVDGIRQWAEGNSMSGYKIGYVTGDNIKDKIPQLLKDGWTFPNFDYDGNFNDILDKIYNCNVYIGHEGIERCLAEGADVVITGRAADSALFLAPLKYEFGWAADDWDNLARGIMAGHLLECGGQGAGGNYMYDWRNVPRMDELGFPIAELTDDTFEITKAPDCGGIICEQSCKEQFLYEVHDPANYLTPDVNVDISHATITQVGDNRVRIGGVKGKPRPDTLKLCVGYHKGWKTVSMLSFAWPDAYEKAQYCAEVIMKKMQRRGMKADDIHISYIGLNSLHANGPRSHHRNAGRRRADFRHTAGQHHSHWSLRVLPLHKSDFHHPAGCHFRPACRCIRRLQPPYQRPSAGAAADSGLSAPPHGSDHARCGHVCRVSCPETADAASTA